MSDAPAAPAAPAATSAPTGVPSTSTTAPAGGAAPPQAHATPPAPPERKTFKASYRGQEREVPEEMLPVYLSKAFGADEVFRTAAQQRKEYEAFKERLKSDTRKLLEEHGLNPTDLGKQWVIGQYEQEAMTPEQRELAQAKSKLQEMEAAKAKEAEEREQQTFKAETEKRKENYRTAFLGAAQQELGLEPGSPLVGATLARMARMAEAALDGDVEYTPQQLAAAVREEWRAETRQSLKGLQGKALLDHLGPDVARAVAVALLEARKGAPGIVAPVQTQPPAPAREQPRASNGQFAQAARSREELTWNRMMGKGS